MSRTFSITSASEKLKLADNARGEITFTVSNRGNRAVRGRLKVVPLESTKVAWLTIAGEVERDFPAGATHQVTVAVEVPRGASPGRQTFRIDVSAADNPDEDFAEGPVVSFEIEQSETPPKAFPWWVLAVIAGALVVVGLSLFLILRSGDEGDEEPDQTPTVSPSPIPTVSPSPRPTVPGLGTVTLVSPPDGSVFGNFPRTTSLGWVPLPNAASYVVEIDCLGCCGSQWCADVGRQFRIARGITATSYTFDFVGAQPGRWRVWGVDAAGQEGPKSPWWGFRYTQ